ncbi:MAG TPA: hypothetical protein DE312_10035 [Gallionella sp.]|nr:hypothetical protein [Gallionella sp.]
MQDGMALCFVVSQPDCDDFIFSLTSGRLMIVSIADIGDVPRLLAACPQRFVYYEQAAIEGMYPSLTISARHERPV